jgi:hypothetical protein
MERRLLRPGAPCGMVFLPVNAKGGFSAEKPPYRSP